MTTMARFALTVIGSILLAMPASADVIDAKIYSNVSCLRDLIYSTATTFTDIPIIRKDVTDAYIQAVMKYAGNGVNEEELDKDATLCQDLKKKARAQSKEELLQEEAFYQPTEGYFNSSRYLKPIISKLETTSGVKELIYSTVNKSELCRSVEANVVGGYLGFVGVGVNVAYCYGRGGQRWFYLSPQGYVGLGGGVGALAGLQQVEQREGWSSLPLNFEYTGIIGGGYVGGVYASAAGEDGDSHLRGGGVVIGTTGFSMVGTRLKLRVARLPDDKNWILKKLGRPQRSTAPSSSEELQNPLAPQP